VRKIIPATEVREGCLCVCGNAADGRDQDCRVAIRGELGTWVLLALNELQQTGFQDTPGCLRQFHETEGLEPALSGPHGEHHLHFFADGGLAEVEDQLDLQFFVEWILQVHQTAGSGKLMQFAPHLAPVGQSNERQDRAAQLNPKGAVLAAEQFG
jgi:hypothetical protein